MQSTVDVFNGRKAPYAPISSLEQFLQKVQDRTAPERVDHRYLARLGVASNNEYALLSALKFLGLVDGRGLPTHAFRLIQTTDPVRFQETLRHLVQTAYAPVVEAGADAWPLDELINFFRHASSPSQAKNAARFFRAVCKLSGIRPGRLTRSTEDQEAVDPSAPETVAGALVDSALRPPRPLEPEVRPDAAPGLASYKARLLDKLPAMRPEWSAEEYAFICDRFLQMLAELRS